MGPELKTRGLSVFLLLGIMSSLLGVFFYWYKPFFLTGIDLRAWDTRFILRGTTEPAEEVLIVAVDEKSVNELGRWPWPRKTIAELIAALKSARVVVLDMVFSEEQDQENDRALSDAVKDSEDVILGYFFRNDATEEPREDSLDQLERSKIKFVRYLDEEGGDLTGHFPGYEFLGVEPNIPVIGESAKGFGSFNIFPDEDGIYRVANLVYKYRDGLYPSLAVEALRMYLDDEPVILAAGYGIDSLGINTTSVPLNEQGGLYLNFYGPGSTFPTYPAVDVIKGKVSGHTFRDKIVFVGITEKAVYDIRPTPVDALFPGVEVHATVAGNILQKRFLIQDGRTIMVDLVLILLLPVLLSVILSRLHRTYQGLGVFLILIFLIFLGNLYLFLSLNLVTSVVYPLLPLAITYLACEAYRNVVVESRHRFMKKAFTAYVSPQLLTELLKYPDRLKLGGEKRVISVLFSDVRAFTALSEKLAAEELVALLNEYLSPMTRILLDEEGTLDKYVGDAIMAIFNAPVEVPEHPYRVCRAALKMREKLAELNEAWQKRGLPGLEVGIGINTGEAVVGNMGADLRFDYTAIGDTVNLASRLEGMNKLYGVSIIISEFTYGFVKDGFLLRELDLVRVRGRKEPSVVYELMELKPGDESKQALSREFEAALGEYRRRDFLKAKKSFEDILNRYPDDVPSKLYLVRCTEYLKTPPPSDWDGVFVVKTK